MKVFFEIINIIEGLNTAINSMVFSYDHNLTIDKFDAMRFLAELQAIKLEELEKRWLFLNNYQDDHFLNELTTKAYLISTAFCSLSDSATSDLIAIDSLINSAHILCSEQATIIINIRDLTGAQLITEPLINVA